MPKFMAISSLHVEYLVTVKSTETECALLEKLTSVLALHFVFVTDTNITWCPNRQTCETADKIGISHRSI
jgi:hypothetical protein